MGDIFHISKGRWSSKIYIIIFQVCSDSGQALAVYFILEQSVTLILFPTFVNFNNTYNYYLYFFCITANYCKL